jgi:hypothetical protein
METVEAKPARSAGQEQEVTLLEHEPRRDPYGRPCGLARAGVGCKGAAWLKWNRCSLHAAAIGIAKR